MNTVDNAIPVPSDKSARTFFGEPRALAYLVFTEAWERFSYYGMTAILVLYMSQALFMPGHVEHVLGFAAFRAFLESLFGPMSSLAIASQIYGIYTAFVYFTPVFGGYVADRWLGRRNAVVIGAVSMSGGHLAMAFDGSFLLALVLLVIGCGFLKGNISTQVGTLYAPTNSSGRSRGFSIFSIGINVGAVAGPLAVGFLAQEFGWHAGFGLAGVLMLIGLATYLAGYRELSDTINAVRPADIPKAKLTRADWQTVGCLAAVMLVTVFQSIAYYQNSNIALIWIDSSVSLDFFGFHIPVAWFNSIDPLASIVAVPALLGLWTQQGKRASEPGDVAKIGIGAWIACAANLFLVLGCAMSDKVPAVYPVIYDVLLGVGFLYYWPTLLALVSRAAPAGIKSTLMGTAFLTLFIADFIVGWLGGFYERMTPLEFWAMHAGIAALGGILTLAFGRRLEALLDGRVA